ncbi:MAG: serine hydrolase domain-containing protein [Bacillota bacterium]|nr:serine hydrolase domain-containing protein [Bacillota bacterium]
MIIKDKNALDRVCENFIKNTMDFYDIPGITVGVCAVGVEQKDAEGTPYFFTGAGGYRNYETKDLVQADTVFHCTSVSKLFTVMGIMRLVEDGKLSLSDHLVDVLPYLSIADERWKNITIESMLEHTSGLTDVGDYHWEEHKTADDSLKEYALSDEVSGRKLLWDPLAGKFRYSSTAYDLLGLVIAEVSGMPFEEFVAREVFGPLGMDDTTFFTFGRISELNEEVPECKRGCEDILKAIDEAGLAMPHYKGRDRVIHLEKAYPYTRQHAPSSTLTSTTGDLLKWAAALMKRAPLHEDPEEAQSAPLHEKTVQDMWESRVSVPDTGEKMGLGWFMRKQSVTAADGEAYEYTLVGHEGSDDGFRTSFWMCPELGIATALLCNLTDAPLKKLNKQLFEAVVMTFM